MHIVDKAMEMALVAHAGQVNNHDGELYVLHLQRVWIAVRDRGLDPVHQAVAWLHDSLEDTELSLYTIMNTFPQNPEIASSVAALTKNKGESNEDYYNRMLDRPIAARVKAVGDIPDNFSRNHLILDEGTRLRMGKKYSLGLSILKDFR